MLETLTAGVDDVLAAEVLFTLLVLALFVATVLSVVLVVSLVEPAAPVRPCGEMVCTSVDGVLVIFTTSPLIGGIHRYL